MSSTDSQLTVSDFAIGDEVSTTILYGRDGEGNQWTDGKPKFDGDPGELPEGVACPVTVHGVVVGYGIQTDTTWGTSGTRLATPLDEMAMVNTIAVKMDPQSLKDVSSHWIEEPGYPPQVQFFHPRQLHKSS